MTDPETSRLEERVARLERQVEALLAGTEEATRRPASERPSPERSRPDEPLGEAPRPEGDRAGPGGSPDPSRPRAEAPGSESTPTRPSIPRYEPSLAREGEKWLARVGVGFVVLAFAFLLKLSFDRGWITPALRLTAGFVTGAGLIAAGIRLEHERSRLAQAMIGGGVALLYLVAFAGAQLYEILPLLPALSLMTTTTVLAIVLAERQDSPALSIIGVLGGLATPFLLNLPGAHPAGTAVYVSLVLLGAAPVQLLKGWPGLLGALAVGGALALTGLAFASHSLSPFWPLLGLTALFWATTVASPVLRPLLRPEAEHHGHVWIARAAAAWGTTWTALLLILHFELSRTPAGFVLGGLGLLAVGLAVFARYEPRASAPAAEVGAVTVAVGLLMVGWPTLGVFLLMAEACLLLVLAARGAPPSLADVGHGLAATAAFGFVGSMAYADPGGPLGLTEGGAWRLGVLALAVVAALWTDEPTVYRGAAYVGLLAWVLAELWYRPNGQALISVAWALQGTLALVASIPRDSQTLQLGGLATLGLVAAKLLLVDLAQLDPVWRIVLFLGFGATLLGLGYLVNRERPGDTA